MLESCGLKWLVKQVDIKSYPRFQHFSVLSKWDNVADECAVC